MVLTALCCSAQSRLAVLSPAQPPPCHRQARLPPAVAVPDRPAGGSRQLWGHHLDWQGHGVQTDRAWGGKFGALWNSRYGIMQRLSYLTKLEEDVGADTMFNLRNSPKNKNIDRKMKNLQSDVCERIFIFIFLLMKILQFSWSWINSYHFGCDTNHIYLEITCTWNSISRLQEGGGFRKIDQPWTTTSWAGPSGTTTRRASCRRLQVRGMTSVLVLDVSL